MDLHLDLFGYRPAFSVTSMVGLLFHLHHDAGLRTLCEAFFADFQPVGPAADRWRPQRCLLVEQWK
jgi:hypothetical protein